MPNILKTVRTEQKLNHFGQFSIGEEEGRARLLFTDFSQNYRLQISGGSHEYEKSWAEPVHAYDYEVDAKELEEFGKACVKIAKEVRKKG